MNRIPRSEEELKQDLFRRVGIKNTETREYQLVLKASYLESPIGPMLALADDQFLYLLEFLGRRGLEQELIKLKNSLKAAISLGTTHIIDQVSEELTDYFSGRLKDFKTPIKLTGTQFQKRVWEELLRIPYGTTLSYLEEAKAIGNEKGVRAVANANGRNQIALIAPCHRVINTGGQLGGYGGGIEKKEWLLQHEAKYK